MNKTLRYALQFSNWCVREKLDPLQVAALIDFSLVAARAGEKHCNEGTEKAQTKYYRAMARAEKMAEIMKLKTTWPGLYPDFTNKSGFSVDLPYPE